MIDSIIKGFEVWTDAQGLKSKGRVKSIDNISLEGISKLRELILNLAIQGKLVSQEQNDIHPSVLFKDILLPELPKDYATYLLPKNWIWVRNDYLFRLIKGKKPKNLTEEAIGSPYLDIDALDRNVYKQYSSETNCPICTTEDILVVCDGSRSGLVLDGQNGIIGSTLALIDTRKEFQPYIKLLFLKLFKELNNSMKGAAIPHLDSKRLLSSFTGIPPLEEQKRIVTKVNELMALCDKLEEEQTKNLTTHHHLVECLLETLTQVNDADELQSSWEKISQNFDTLFCTVDSIDHLKQTILQLAVMGKLVKQDPDDEPASELLKKIIDKKAELIKEGKLKEEKPSSEITEDETLFSIPNSWMWTRLGDIAKLNGGYAYKSTFFNSDGINQVIRMGNIRPDFLRLDESPVFISEQYASETSDYKIEIGDILITMTGTKDKRDYLYSLLINEKHLNEKTLYLNQRLCLFRLILIKPEFINTIIKVDTILDSVFAQSTGTANQANIGMNTLKNWVLPIPPLKEQVKILKRVDEIFSICDLLKEKISKTEQIKSILSSSIIEVV